MAFLNEAADLRPLVERSRAACRPRRCTPPRSSSSMTADTTTRAAASPSWEAVFRACTRSRRKWRARHRGGVGELVTPPRRHVDLHNQTPNIRCHPRRSRAYRRRCGRSGADIIQGARSDTSRGRDLRFVLWKDSGGCSTETFGMCRATTNRGSSSAAATCSPRARVTGRYRHWQCFVMVAAHHKGYRIHEVETPFRARRSGRSAFGSLALGPALGVALDLVTALREYQPVSR